jgi:hypothetical protein
MNISKTVFLLGFWKNETDKFIRKNLKRKHVSLISIHTKLGHVLHSCGDLHNLTKKKNRWNHYQLL